MSFGPYRFGLIVTGRGEESFLHDLFNRELMPQAYCLFEVVRFFPQLRPTTSPRQPQAVTGTQKRILSRDEELGLAAYGYLRVDQRRCVLVIDDLEGDDPAPVFHRYRNALDSVIQAPGLALRASVHFLVNMVEAYYFAHVQPVNAVAGRQVLDGDHPTDVELIGHPKGRLRELWPEFHEIDHGKEIVKRLDLLHVLARSAECCWLRALIAWCVDKLKQETAFYDALDPTKYCLNSGCKSAPCYPQ